ncbi:MAG: LysR family transcriptional regulator [Rhodobacteraceae bacterium CG17_big_fil_post_rev_8_21_14_2_50_65_11]|nr:MAG: LysR family transcriptional regulator [Rhodobacteraceae bacterium CG17_big_fil_post_rev_8_21_14_2_50_65_11]
MPIGSGLTLKHLRCLTAVAEHRSLTAAAAARNLTTPAIHSQIKGLEAQVGRPVVFRAADGTGFDLTQAGRVLLRAADRIEASLSQAGAALDALAQGHQGHVTLSVVSTAKYFAPRLVRLLGDAAPEIAVRLRVGNRGAVIEDLEAGRADLAIMGRPPRRPVLEAEPLGPHPHGVILPPGHPLAGHDGFDPAALLAETFLSREQGSGTRTLMARFLDRFAEGVEPEMIEMDSNETIKQAVIAGLGVAFLSLHTVCDELATGRLVLLRGPAFPVMRHWYLMRPSETPPTNAARRIAEKIINLGGVYFPTLPCAPSAAPWAVRPAAPRNP